MFICRFTQKHVCDLHFEIHYFFSKTGKMASQREFSRTAEAQTWFPALPQKSVPEFPAGKGEWTISTLANWRTFRFCWSTPPALTTTGGWKNEAKQLISEHRKLLRTRKRCSSRLIALWKNFAYEDTVGKSQVYFVCRWVVCSIDKLIKVKLPLHF